MANGSSAQPYLRIRKVDKHFGGFQALKNISLDIFAGEFVCFLGPSGCGKTTLLRAIAGLDFQDKGTIEQAGKDISAMQAHVRPRSWRERAHRPSASHVHDYCAIRSRNSAIATPATCPPGPSGL